MKLIHGGDVMGYQEEFGSRPLDFSANINPLGLPAGVAQAVCDSLARADEYPDPLCRTLCRAIAKAEGVLPNQVLCGNGAADLIFRLVLAKKPQRALITAPTFAEYEQALALVDCHVEHHTLRMEENFDLTPRIFGDLEGKDIVFLCNPNNPTGRLIPPDMLERVVAACHRQGTLVVVDECFNSFLDDPVGNTLKPLLRRHPNLVLLKAFTKFYAMAGLRLGYALCADHDLLKQAAQSGQPWGVSTVAQAAGIAALRETEYAAKSRQLIVTERRWLWNALEEQGQRVVGGSANYLFFCTDVLSLAEKMRRKGVLIRCCGNYKGLDDRWHRVAVRTREENKKLIDTLTQIRAKG